MKKKIFGMMVSLCMIMGEGPPIFAQTGSNSNIAVTKDKSASSLLETMEKQINEKPDGYDQDTATPYNTGKNEKFTILENMELFSLMSYDVNNDSKRKVENSIVKADANNRMQKSEGSIFIPDSSLESYSQGVSFDPKDSGKRSYMGVIGYRDDIHAVVLYIFDAENKKQVDNIVIDDSSAINWIRNCDLDTVRSKNYFQITAGDYDGDGKDTLIVYCGSMNGSGNALKEVYFDQNRQEFKVRNIESKDILNRTYFDSGMYNSSNIGDRLGVSLATGDINNDGIDDLVAMSAAGKISVQYQLKANGVNGFEACKPTLGVAYGKKNATFDQMKKSSQKVSQKINGNEYVMASAGLAIGDINGDGINEVVTAGFQAYYTEKNLAPLVIQNGSKNDGTDAKAAFAYFRFANNNLNRVGDMQILSGKSQVSPISGGDSLRDGNDTWQQFAVACVGFDSAKAKKQIFLNGYVYELNGSNLSVISNYENQYFDKLKTKTGQIGDVNENFIYSTAIGNFNNDKDGAESISMTVGCKENGNADDYFFQRITLRKDKKTKKYVFDGLNENENSYFSFDNRGDNWNQRMNCLVIAVDSNNDSVIGRYNSRNFGYSDPNVVAFLQAAPYFKELGAENSATTYGYSESYTKSTSKGTEISYNLGVTAGLELGPVSTSVTAGKASELAEEYTKSRTQEYTTTFEANEHNQVIMRRTLIYYYYYDIMDKNGQFKDNNQKLVVAVPQYPVMSTLTVDEYNDFVKLYNQKPYAKTKMKAIDDTIKKKYYLNNEGNPFNYANSKAAYKNGIELSKNEQWIELSHAGGTTQKESADFSEESYSKTASDGMYMDMSSSVSAGSDLFSIKVSVGIDASYEKLNSNTSATAKAVGTITGGSVQNLDVDHKDYRFNWRLMGWKTEGEIFKDVLFVGYIVRGATAPVQMATDLKATYTGKKGNASEKVTLTWTSPEIDDHRGSIKAFDIYEVNGDDYTKLNSNEIVNQGEGKEHSFELNVDSNNQKAATYVVQSIAQKTTDMDSLYSNEAYCLFAMSGDEVTKLVNQTKSELETKITDLQKIINDKNTDVQDLIDQYKLLDAAYKNADDLLKKYTDEQAGSLKQTMQSADATLDAAIKKVQKNLDDAVKALNKTIEDQNQVQTDRLNKAINDVTKAYVNADALLKSDINQNIDALKQSINDANKSLMQSVDQVQKNLDDAVKALNKTINDQDQNQAKKLSDAVNNLTEAYASADILLKADIDQNIDALKQSMNDANKSLMQSIDQVQKNLDDAVKALNKTINDQDQNQAKKLSDTVNNLTKAYASADILLKADIDQNIEALKKSVKDANQAMNVSINQVQKNLDDAVKALNKAIDAKDQTQTEQLTKSIDDVNAAYEAADVLLKSDFTKNIDELKQSMTNAHQVLKAAIEQVQKNLDDAVESLNKTIENQKQESSKALKEAVDQVKNEYEAANALQNTQIDELKTELANLKSSMDQNHQVVTSSIQKMSQISDDALTQSIQNLNKTVTDQKEMTRYKTNAKSSDIKVKTIEDQKPVYDQKIFAMVLYGKNMKISWNRIAKADGYQIYVAKYAPDQKLIDQKNLARTITQATTLKTSLKTLPDGSRFNKKAIYMVQVRAYRQNKKSKRILTKSPKCYVVNTSNKKLMNVRKMTLSKRHLTLKKGTKKALNVKMKSSKKKVFVATRYYTTNKKVVTVSKKGKITAKKKGTCRIYAVSANGANDYINITVK